MDFGLIGYGSQQKVKSSRGNNIYILLLTGNTFPDAKSEPSTSHTGETSIMVGQPKHNE